MSESDVFGFIMLVAVGSWFVFALIGRYVAKQKGRNGAEGFWLAFLLGPIGILIEALLPTKAEATS